MLVVSFSVHMLEVPAGSRYHVVKMLFLLGMADSLLVCHYFETRVKKVTQGQLQ